MARFESRLWQSSVDLGLPRRDRRSCRYQVYLPDQLQGRTFLLEGQVVADVSDAEDAIRKLNAEPGTMADTEALAPLLLRTESVASSRIEGLEVGARRLLRFQLAQQIGEDIQDVTAAEVLANIEAMAWGVAALARAPAVTVDAICEVHRRLLETTHLAVHAGILRKEQNWIGGSSYNPCAASFVPPPPEAVPALVEDLCAFMNDDCLSPVVQAAIAHAQFETIHPFADGNGRTGRTLIHVVLRRRGLAPRLVPPISLVLATRSADYVAGLGATRYVGEPDSSAATEGINRWISTFAVACARAVDDAWAFEQKLNELREQWRVQCGYVRQDSAVARLLQRLPGTPLITVQGAAALISRSVQATNEAVRRLVEAGVLEQVTVGRRNRAFEAVGVLDAFAVVERRLASPAGDTRRLPPIRPVPRGRNR